MVTLPSRQWIAVLLGLLIAGGIPLFAAIGPTSSQVTPEGPSTANGAWTLRSFPPTAFPESGVAEAAALAREADQLLRQGRRNDAIAAWRRAIALDPAHPSAYWRLASVGTTDNAERSALIQRQVQAAPSPPAYLHGAFILQSIGLGAEALTMWREGVRRYPDDRNMAALFGEALLRRNLADEAVVVLEREVLARPNSSRLRLHLGRAYLATGEAEAGLAELREAGRLEDTPTMWLALARILATSGADPNEALVFAYRTAEAAERDSADLTELPPNLLLNVTISLVRAWDVMSLVHAARNEVDAATDYGLAAWRLAPDVGTLTRLGRLHRDRGDRDAAVAYLARAAIQDPSPAAAEARRELQALVPASPIGPYVEEARAWAQQSRVVTFTIAANQAVRNSVAIRVNRAGEVLDVMATGTAADSLTPHLEAIRRLALPGLPAGATVEQVLLPWNLSCDSNGLCSLWPASVPRSSPFDFE